MTPKNRMTMTTAFEYVPFNLQSLTALHASQPQLDEILRLAFVMVWNMTLLPYTIEIFIRRRKLDNKRNAIRSYCIGAGFVR